MRLISTTKGQAAPITPVPAPTATSIEARKEKLRAFPRSAEWRSEGSKM